MKIGLTILEKTHLKVSQTLDMSSLIQVMFLKKAVDLSKWDEEGVSYGVLEYVVDGDCDDDDDDYEDEDEDDEFEED